MDVKIIALDLDKTLLHNNGDVSKYSLDILKKCQEYGILIAIATSRSEFSAKKYVELINPDIVITSGGAVARVGEKILHKVLISQTMVNSIIKDGLSHPSVECIRIMGEKHELSNNTNVPKGKKDYGHYDYSDLSEPLKEAAWKIQFETKDISFLQKIQRKYPECTLVSYVNENLHKLANVKANKRDAMLSVCDYYKIKMENVAAFGDDSSDYELLVAAGYGVVVENGITKVKDIADYISESNENDGVAKFIETNILKVKIDV